MTSTVSSPLLNELIAFLIFLIDTLPNPSSPTNREGETIFLSANIFYEIFEFYKNMVLNGR